MPETLADRDRLRVGFARRIITPSAPHWPLWLSGFGARTEPAAGIHDDLEVRVMVARTGRAMAVLVALDLMAMSVDWADAIRGAVACEVGCDPDEVLTHTIHTHAAPSTITGTDALGWVVPRAWQRELVDACVGAAREAAASACSATVRVATGSLPAGFAFNRRSHPDVPAFTVVDILAASGGARLGTIVNTGVHPVVLGPKNLDVSADWVGALRRSLDDRLGGCALFVQGCEGDVDPSAEPWDDGRDARHAVAARVGIELADAVVAASNVAIDTGDDALVMTARTITCDASTSPMAAITGITDVEVELYEWRLGGVRFVSVPGEGFAALGAAIAAARAPDPVVVCGLAPHWLGYLPVPFADGYEEGLSYGQGAVAQIAAALA